MSINYGGIQFNDPVRVTEWLPPFRAGLYAILVPDQSASPKPFRAIYFGESSNLSERGFLRSHIRYNSWIREAYSNNNLYISVHYMPDSTQQQRMELEKRLIDTYHPVCNHI
jgi:hypothetical protein